MKAMLVCLLALAAVALGRPDDKYTDKYDNLDLDEILNNERLRKPYIMCVMGEGKCSAEGKELTSHVKEALEDGCSKCSEKQLAGVKKVIKFLLEHSDETREEWRQLCAKYDPENKYSKKYEKEFKELQS